MRQISWWGRAGGDADSRWHQSPPVSLALHNNLLAADIAVSSSGAIRVLAVTGSEPSKVTILTVSGNPTVLRPDGALCQPPLHIYIMRITAFCFQVQYVMICVCAGKPYEELRVQELATLPVTVADHRVSSATYQPDTAGSTRVPNA